jgi:hypothetical protein
MCPNYGVDHNVRAGLSFERDLSHKENSDLCPNYGVDRNVSARLSFDRDLSHKENWDYKCKAVDMVRMLLCQDSV